MSDAVCDRHGATCPSYRAEHSVHFIQARKVSEYLDYFPERCRSVELSDLGEGHFSTVIDGAALRGWNHFPEQVTEFAERSHHGLVQYIPYSGVLTCARIDEAGRITGRGIINPFWEGGASPVTPEDTSGGVDGKYLFSRAVDTEWNCDTYAPGHGCTGGVPHGDLPTGDLSDEALIPVTFGGGFGGHIGVAFPDGSKRTAYHCDDRYLMIFIMGTNCGEVFYHPGTGLLVTGGPAHRKFLSISWEPLDLCSRSELRRRQYGRGLDILDRYRNRRRDDTDDMDDTE